MRNDLPHLYSAHARLTNLMIGRPAALPLVFCHVDPLAARLVVGVAELTRSVRRTLRVGSVPMSLVAARPAVRHAKKRDWNRPLLGGIYIACPDVDGEGTICIGVPRQGASGFVTCGHVIGRAGIQVFQPRKSTVNDWLVGASTVVSNYTTTAGSDSAFIAAPEGVAITNGAIWRSSTSHYQVTTINAAPPPGAQVSMQGASSSTTVRNGIICGTDVTVTFEDQGVLTGQLLANYQSTVGDSGAPVFIVTGDPFAALVGLNVGATAPADAKPTPDPYTYPPASNGTYAVISPWTNVVQDLGL